MRASSAGNGKLQFIMIICTIRAIWVSMIHFIVSMVLRVIRAKRIVRNTSVNMDIPRVIRAKRVFKDTSIYLDILTSIYLDILGVMTAIHVLRVASIHMDVWVMRVTEVIRFIRVYLKFPQKFSRLQRKG
jgi:hypothetical protein